MKIDSSLTADAALIVMNGRLDASWSPMVAAALEEAIRSGRSRIELDLANVDFISSVGIGVLLKALARLRAVKGAMIVTAASAPVREMFRISRLDVLLGVTSATNSTAVVTSAIDFSTNCTWTGSLTRESVRGVARPTFIRTGIIRATPSTLAIGHMALAADEASAHGLFGEGLIAGGTVAVAPAGAPRPDCLASSDAGAVSCIVRNTLVVDAPFSMRGYFEWNGNESISLSALARQLVKVSGGAVAFIAVGECAGAFGAWARISPDEWSTQPSGMTPTELRASLRFAGDPMHRSDSMVAVVFAADTASRAILPAEVSSELILMRDDVAPSDDLFLHAHVAVASYRPVPRSTQDPSAAGQLLAEQPLRAVMHALRNAEGIETAFLRGSIWAIALGGSA